MKRRSFLRTSASLTTATGAVVVGLPWLAGCGGGGSAAAPAPAPADPSAVQSVSLGIDLAASGTPVNRSVLGSNVQWVDNGDNLLGASGNFDATQLGLAQGLAPSVLRYPGGLQSDTFRWEQATNEHAFTRELQPTRMNTQRVLELCEATGATPMFTVNVITGSADEAARWVRQTNITRLTSSATGRLLPTVPYWEIGNEPYLKVDGRPELDLAPAEFARRANAFIAAMRAVDAGIRIGLPLTLDTRNGLPITAYPGFSRTVLAAVTERFDFACIHNAYLPLVFTGAVDLALLYPGTMAAAEAVRDDFAATRALLSELRPGSNLPLAVTEHAPLFSLGEGATDNWSTTPLGALYLADLIRVFAETPDLLLANHWSLSGNGRFGALGGQGAGGFRRAAGEVLALAGQALRGNRLTPTLRCDSIATAAIGLVPARSALPLFSALVTREGSTVRALLIQKDPTRGAQVGLTLTGGSARSASLTALSCGDVTDARDVAGLWQSTVSTPAAGSNLALTLPAHSVALLELSV